MTDRRNIIAIGGRVLVPEDGTFAFERYILESSRTPKPKVCFLATATGDDPTYIARFYQSYTRFDCRPDHLQLFHRTPPDLLSYMLSFDVIHVGGGNTRSMLAVWKHWGLDVVLRKAWESGVVLTGSSAGMICWFAESLTDSVAGSLTRTEGLGFLPGSACPHYDGERDRRPTYRRFVADGTLSAGYACDDGAAVHFVGTELYRAVTIRPNADAYRVELQGREVVETPLAKHMLT